MKKRKKRWLRLTVQGTLALIVGGSGLAVYLLQRPPVMYRQARVVLDQTTEAEREIVRDKVLLRLADLTQDADNIELSDVPITRRPVPRVQRFDAYGSVEILQEEQTIPVLTQLNPTARHDEKIDRFVDMTLTNEEMVAFVSEMFVEWTIQRGYIVPGGVNDPVVTVKEGDLGLAFAIQTPFWEQVFSGGLNMEFKDNGMAIGKVKNLRAGSLPVNLNSVGDVLHRKIPAEHADYAKRLSGWLDKLDHFEFRPVIELQNRRRARVYAMETGQDSVTFKLRVQDRLTYKEHNHMLNRGEIAVTDRLDFEWLKESEFTGVPTTSD